MTTHPLPLPSDQDATGRSFGAEELLGLEAVINSGILTSTKGTMVQRLEAAFAAMLGVKHAIACASGTAAMHVAIASLELEPGDEVITTPITDMGALTPILYQGAIPVFADVDTRTLNVTADSIQVRLSDRTRAVVATHLFGSPCDMEPILALAAKEGLAVIEDCAQAFLARSHGRLVGTIGRLGCFSLQQGKHITSGEGGLVVTDDDHLARRAYLLVNKGWGYGDANPDHYFLALNYRLSELQGAVALAQLDKLDRSVKSRVDMAYRLTETIGDIDGIEPPFVGEADVHSFWRYAVTVDPAVITGGSVALGRLLAEAGISCAPRYIQKPAYQCAVFKDQRTFGNSRWPFTLARLEAVDYSEEKYPGVVHGLERVLVLPWTERYELTHIEYIADQLRRAAAFLQVS
jgi:dTDP-4-amino-4,6-dideoxygalactose transaminase